VGTMVMGILECGNRMRRGRVTFQHTVRNGNKRLAQLALIEGDRVWIEEVPPQVYCSCYFHLAYVYKNTSFHPRRYKIMCTNTRVSILN